jgi:hypothetical protein
LASVGGPMNDLAHIDFIQSRFPQNHLVPIVRFRMAIEFGGMLAFMLLAPALFEWWGARWVVAFAGFLTLFVGTAGLLRFGEKREETR